MTEDKEPNAVVILRIVYRLFVYWMAFIGVWMRDAYTLSCAAFLLALPPIRHGEHRK